MARPRDRHSARSYSRMSRVNGLLRRVLAEEIAKLVDTDERLKMVTVTEVRCESDLRRAVVYLDSLPTEVEEAFVDLRRPLQSRLGEQIRMRRIPTLEFAADPAIAAGARIEAALRRAEARRLEEATEVAQPDAAEH